MASDWEPRSGAPRLAWRTLQSEDHPQKGEKTMPRFTSAFLLLLLTASAPAARAALPAGTVVNVQGIPCPTTSPNGGDPTPPVPAGGRLSCGRVLVTNCPGAPDLNATVWIVTLAPGTTLKGTIFLHSGGGGTANFTSSGASHHT